MICWSDGALKPGRPITTIAMLCFCCGFLCFNLFGFLSARCHFNAGQAAVPRPLLLPLLALLPSLPAQLLQVMAPDTCSLRCIVLVLPTHATQHMTRASLWLFVAMLRTLAWYQPKACSCQSAHKFCCIYPIHVLQANAQRLRQRHRPQLASPQLPQPPLQHLAAAPVSMPFFCDSSDHRMQAIRTLIITKCPSSDSTCQT